MCSSRGSSCCSCSSSCGSCGSCGSSCDCGCGGVGGVETETTLRFPVYVSYPAFFPTEAAVNNANMALFVR